MPFSRGTNPYSPRQRFFARLSLSAILFTISSAHAADIADGIKLFNTGKYPECLELCSQTLAAGDGTEEWWSLKIRTELAIGRNPQAFRTFAAAIDRYDASVQLRLLGHDVLLANNDPTNAIAILATIKTMGDMAPWRFDSAADRVAIGQAAAMTGTDARQVLENYFDKAKTQSPQSPLPYLASGDLALHKQDFALAAECFREAVKRDPENPDAYLGLARAYTDDATEVTKALKRSLELNPNHVDSLLFQADNLIDREEYDQAETILKKALEINPKTPLAWAYRAVIANLTGDKKAEEVHREEALSTWKTNPEVDWLIGKKLSHEYSFAEGAAAQRRALAMNDGYLPAKMQLSEDLLRLGQEKEGWALAEEVFRLDPYNVLAYNLITLRDVIAKFKILENEHFELKMDPKEATIYGSRALDLLARARQKLTAKYAVNPPNKTTIEIFPAQKDFAIRTFGLPGGEGFLGVCFGPVVTVNSPAAQGAHQSNWEAILWHEFCHSITLYKTNNKMPRWLSEGISVYEELQENPSWGQKMTPDYREMILKGEATPVSKLSSAFMKPPTPQHLMFAYYESSQVIEYIVKNFGTSALNEILTDLGNGININVALSKHTVPIEKLDTDFAAYLKDKAENLAKVDWEPLHSDESSAAIAAWNKLHPNNFWGILGEGRALVTEHKFKEAKPLLEKAIELYPAYVEGGGAYLPLAVAHRELGETNEERATIEKFIALEPDAVDPRLRLIALAAADKDWKTVRAISEQLLAINPLIPAPHRFLAQAATATNDRSTAIEARRTLLLLDPLDKVEQHYQLASLLYAEQKYPEAHREVIFALEDAPRFRAAHTLLLHIAEKMPTPTPPASMPATTAPAATETPWIDPRAGRMRPSQPASSSPADGNLRQ